MKKATSNANQSMAIDPSEAYHSSRRHVTKQNFSVGGNSTGGHFNKQDPKRMTAVTGITFNPQTPGGGQIGGVVAGGG